MSHPEDQDTFPEEEEDSSNNTALSPGRSHHQPMEGNGSPLDRRIMATADEALWAKHAAVQAGYYDDPFVQSFLLLDTFSSSARVNTPATGRHVRGGGSATAATEAAPAFRAGPLHTVHPPRPLVPQRPPVQVIIKRGTAARVACMDRVISTFLQAPASTDPTHSSETISSSSSYTTICPQIVVLGAGKDTTFFRWVSGRVTRPTPEIQPAMTKVSGIDHISSVKWCEVDHGCLIQDKIAASRASPDTVLAGLIESVVEIDHELLLRSDPAGASGGPKVHQVQLRATQTAENPQNKNPSPSSCYWVAYDLRQDPTGLCQILENVVGLDRHAPTLFLSECVHMYLPETDSRQVWRALSQHFDRSMAALYEPILENTTAVLARSSAGPDAFGRVMEQNMMRSGLAAPDSSLLQCRTLTQQLDKLLEAGFGQAVGCDMLQAFDTIVPTAQRQRAIRCEFLDEVEEWRLIMQHYCFAVACTASYPHAEDFLRTDGRSWLGWAENASIKRTRSMLSDQDRKLD